MKRFLFIFAFAAILLGFAGSGTVPGVDAARVPSPTSELGTAGAPFPGADNLRVLSQTCDGFGNVTARLAWQTYNQGDQWLDVAPFNASFADGTFQGMGAFNLAVSTTDRGGLMPNVTYYARLNTAVFPFWVPSATLAFQTRSCAPGTTVPGAYLQSCDGFGNVTIRFTWPSLNAGDQWMDFSPNNPTFAQGTFLGIGPIRAGQSSVDLGGLRPDAFYYTRINTAVFPFWVPSQTMTFQTIHCSTAPVSCTPWSPGCPPPADRCDPVTTTVAADGTVGSTPGPQTLATITANPQPNNAPRGCVWVTRGENSIYVVGEEVQYCYWVNRPMAIRIQATLPDASVVTIIEGSDDGTGQCVTRVAGTPTGERTVRLFGGAPLVLLDETKFKTQ